MVIESVNDMKKIYKKFNFRGFTLIELLTVIIVLSIVALIIVPIVAGMIESSRKKSFINSVYNAETAIKNELSNNDFESFPSEGILVKTGIKSLERNPFISGKFKKEGSKIIAIQVTDGRYCAAGERENLRVILGECYLLDETGPVVNLKLSSVTSKSIQVVADSYDEESDIVSYEFAINGGSYSAKQTSNVYRWNNLKKGTKYAVKVRVTNRNKLSTVKELNVTTWDFDAPVLTSTPAWKEWSLTKEITITYPERKTNYIFEYTTNNGSTWEVVSGKNTANLTVSKNGVTIIARVRDGYDVNDALSTSYTITTIDDMDPIIASYVKTNSTNTTIDTKVTATQNGMGIGGYYYSVDDGKNWSELTENTTHTYTGLVRNTTYPLMVKVIGKNNRSVTKSLSATTSNDPFVVTYYGANGKEHSKKQVFDGESVPIIGYTVGDWEEFEGWKYGEEVVESLTMPKQNIDLYASVIEAQKVYVRTGHAADKDASRITYFSQLLSEKGCSGSILPYEGDESMPYFITNNYNYSKAKECAEYLLEKTTTTEWPNLRYLVMVNAKTGVFVRYR